MDATRIASLLYPALEPRLAEAARQWSRVDALRALLRRHLPPVTASLFARARPVAEQPGRIEWYSDLAGEPIALDDLPDDERTRILALVEDRLNSIRHLAGRLEAVADIGTQSDMPSADDLLRAARYPHPSCLYVVAGEPVLTYWGLGAPDRKPHAARPVAELPSPPSAWQRLRPLLLGGTLVAMVAALALGAWHWRQQMLQDELAGELAAGLAAECASTAILQALQDRLARIDPHAERFPEMRLDTERELNRCADAAEIDARLAEAGGDCALLPAVAEALSFHDTGTSPFAELESRRTALQDKCDLAEEIDERLGTLGDDCEGISALAGDYPYTEGSGYPLAEPTAKIATAARACSLAAELKPRLSAARGDCTALRSLDRAVGQQVAELARAADKRGAHASTPRGDAPAGHPRHGPLAALQSELDTALARCALADHLTSRLADAQGDCVELASLREIVARQGGEGPPFDGLVRRLDDAMGQCAALNELESRFVRAQGDCASISALGDELERWRDNLRFADIRARVGAEAGICAEASALEQRIADAGMNCEKVRALSGGVGKRIGSHFDQARQALKAKLARCEVLSGFASRLDAAGAHCGRLKALQRDLARESGDHFAPLRKRVSKALAPCRPKPAVAKPPRGAGAYAMSGNCDGNLVISPAGGYHGDRVRHIVSIAPPVNASIGKVVSDNRGCRNCRLKKRNATTWSVQLYYGCGGRGNVPIAYSAYDRSGKLVCSGKGVARCLGRRRR